MDHRLFAILAIFCLALAGGGCASKSARARREQIVMPMQTGSMLQRRVMIESEPVTENPEKKNESKRESKKKAKTERAETEPAEPQEPKKPEDITAPPDRLR